MKKTVFETALDTAEQVMTHVESGQFDLSTPCSEWNLKQLLNHLYNELAWVPELLAGKTVDQVGSALDGDLVGDDPGKSWRSYAAAARKAAASTSPETVVHLSYGNRPARYYLSEVGGDVIVHVWDVAQAIKQAFAIPNELAEAIYSQTKDQADEWRKLGLLGPAKPVAPGASAEAKLLALFGR
jgi:uncharacterized protein (TIGR03086 family)